MNVCHAQETIQVKIQPAELPDVSDISELCDHFGFPATEAALRNRINLIKTYPSQILLVAKDETGKVVGWVHAYEAPSLLSDATVEIGGLVVNQDMRQHGIGKALMTAVEEWALKRGFTEVLLATRIDREDARAFYQAIGYRFVHTTHFLSKALN